MARQIGLADALRKESVQVVEHPGWEERGAASFDPRGVLVHHTGPPSTEAQIGGCIRGRRATPTQRALPGPLAQVVLTPDGVAHVIAAGRANHAGVGDWKGITKGNTRLFGIEAVHPGDKNIPWPDVQIAAYHRVVAAMCRLAGVGADMVAAHGEYALPAGRKVDPAGIDMDAFRAAVAQLLGPVKTPQEVVHPMFDPPHVLEPLVAELACPTGGVWLLSGSGAIYTFGGAPFTGGANNKEYFTGRRAAVLELSPDNRPVVVATSGEKYGPDF